MFNTYILPNSKKSNRFHTKIIELQEAFDNFIYIRENFGPYFKHKTLTNGNRDLNYSVNDHISHIHISVRR